MSYTTTQVIDSFVGGYSKGHNSKPIQGSEISVNMIREQNGENIYQNSLNGKKFIKKFADNGVCRGSYVPSIGSDSTNRRARMFVVIGSSLYSYSYNGTIKRILKNTFVENSTISFAETGGERPFLLIADGTSLYAVNLLDNSTNKVIMPENITGEIIKPSSVAVLNGSIAVSDMNTGYVYYSDPYILSNDTRKMLKKDEDGNVIYEDDGITPVYEDASSWETTFLDYNGTLQYKNAESSSDSVVYLKVIGSVMTVFGNNTIEFWTRGAQQYQTWNRVAYTNMNELGLAATSTVASTNEKIYFIGKGTRNGIGVYRISGTNVDKISPTWLDRKLSENAITAGWSPTRELGFCYTDSDHEFYCFNVGDEMFGYDAWCGDWHKRCSTDNRLLIGEELYHKSKYVYPSYFEGKLFFFSNENGCMFLDDRDYFYEDWSDTDKEKAFIRSRETPVIIDSYKEFIAMELTIEMNVGEVPQNLNPKIGLQVSKDGGMTFGNYQYEYLPLTGEYERRVRFDGLGLCRLMTIRVFTNEPIPFILKNASLRICPTGQRM